MRIVYIIRIFLFRRESYSPLRYLLRAICITLVAAGIESMRVLRKVQDFSHRGNRGGCASA